MSLGPLFQRVKDALEAHDHSGASEKGPKLKQAGIAYEEVTVTVTAGQTSGTGTVTAGSIVIGFYPTTNQDQFVKSIAIVDTTLTLTLLAAATANNVFKIVLLKV